MARTLSLVALLLALTAVVRAEDKDTTYAAIAPGTKYVLTLSYGTNYQNPSTFSTPEPCLNDNPNNSTCLPQVNPYNGDCIRVDYSLNATAPATMLNASSTVRLVGCFSPYSSTNRGWRKANPNVHKDLVKQCSTKIAEGLAPGNGSYLWCPSVNVAASTMRIRLLEECPTGEGGAYKFCAYGQSKGFFQLVPTDTLPSWMLACIGVFATLGPISLALFFVWEFKIKKA